MLRKLFIALLILLFASTAWGTSGHDIGTNLTGHYPLTSNYVDGSGYPTDIGSDGNDATSLEGDAAVSADGLVLDGTGDYAPIPSRTYDVDGSNVSFVFWTRHDNTGSYDEILMTGTSVSYIRFNDNDLGLRIESDTNNDDATGALALSKNVWRMYTIVCSSGTVTMWQDATSLSVSGDVNADNLTVEKIGTSYLGTLSNLRIYENRALTQADVTFLYNQGRHATRATSSSLNKGLIGAWNLDTEHADATYDAKDSTPYGNHGTGTAVVVGASYTEWDGANGTDIDIGTNVVDDGDVTVAAWFYTQGDSVTSYERLWDNGKFVFFWDDASDQIGVASDGSTTVSSAASSVLINTWYHVVAVRDTTGAATKIYINGTQSGSTGDSGTPASGLNNGIIGNNSVGNTPLDGYLSDVRVWSRLLSTAEITQLYEGSKNNYRIGATGSSLSKGLIGHWPLTTDNQDATYDSKDSTPYGNHGTGNNLVVGSTYTEFNAVNSKVDLGTNIVDVGDTTISAWVYTQGSGEAVNEMIYENRKFILFWSDTNDQILLSSDGSTTAASATNSVLINTWYHVVATRPSAGTNTNIYINGLLSGTANQNSGTPASGTANDAIGNNEASTATFDGFLADVRVYNRLLTTSEITLLYEASRGQY